jgi:hypothetical protein
MLCADLVEVKWRDHAGKAKKAQAVLEDISRSGACLQLIRWSCPKGDFAGVVRYCSYREIGYFVGVQFDPACRWSKAKYRPQHLLDLEQLITRKG